MGECKKSTIISGLKGPDGLAFHPLTGVLCVAEKDAGLISSIRNSKRTTLVGEADWVIDKHIAPWTVTRQTPRSFLLESRLHNPAGIAFGGTGSKSDFRRIGSTQKFCNNTTGFGYLNMYLACVPAD